ncbi:MAG: hypothetical protein JW810_10625 [Sedimentisphaerales bacterium]|nr:hypothetical protein [Sedimentisphaerales bacterium]
MNRQHRWQAVFLAAVLGFCAAAIAAEADDDLRAELEEAKQQIRQLRQELSQLKADTSWQYQQALQQELRKVPPAAQASGGTLKLPAGWSIEPYGYLKFDMSYDDSAVVGDNGDYVLWVQPENQTTRADDRTSFTARQSRLGARIYAPDIEDVKVMGLVEVDFYNSEFAAENKGTPMMRHAYGQLTGSDWSLLFGQTSDVLSPLVPSTIAYTVGWFGGNVGYRHPQLRLTKWWTPAKDHTFKVEGAVSRQIRQDADGLGVDDGQDSSSPTAQARASYALPWAGRSLQAGISGHYGKEEIDWDENQPVAALKTAGDDDEVHTWSVNADLLIPLCSTLEVKGEFFLAENYDAHFGGIGQGVNPVTRDEIETVGGWIQLGYKPNERWAFHAGAGMDNPRDNDLNDGNRSDNCFVFGNANYYFTKNLSTGLEVSYWKTDYKNADYGDDFRVQHTWQLSF